MATPAWPVDLPQIPLTQGLVKTLGNNLLRFEPDVGRPIRRRRTSARDDTYQVSMLMTPDQVQRFTSFYGDTLGDGALSFNCLDPIQRAVCTVAIEGQVQITSVTPTALTVAFTLVRYN